VLLVGLGLAQVHCDNGATGVDACRSIEDLRCQLVIGCPGSPVTTEDDVKNCQVFYRDECMHGMPDGLDPDQGTVDQCVNALQAARSCWDSGQTLGPCAIAAVVAGTTPAEVVSGQSPDTTGCQAIQAPQILQACSFLQPSTATATGGSGGTTPTGGTGGAGG
jgi:hypothetical protein